jgi:C4-dicarboxylate-specific signal transduction histidine kinase
MRDEFNVFEAIKEVLNLKQKAQRNCLYSSQLNLPKQLKLKGSRSKFQKILFHLLQNAKQAYQYPQSNQIILLIALINDQQQLVVSVTDGGVGLSWLEKKYLEKFALRLGENQQHRHLQEVLHSLKIDFAGNLQLISAKHRGTTARCTFNLQ